MYVIEVIIHGRWAKLLLASQRGAPSTHIATRRYYTPTTTTGFASNRGFCATAFCLLVIDQKNSAQLRHGTCNGGVFSGCFVLDLARWLAGPAMFSFQQKKAPTPKRVYKSCPDGCTCNSRPHGRTCPARRQPHAVHHRQMSCPRGSSPEAATLRRTRLWNGNQLRG